MSRPDDFRRAVAVLQSGPGQAARPMIGSRSLHQYWALLMQHFRGVLLPPQCRSDDASTQWSWREPVDNPPPTSLELATVRKRLTGAQRSLADAVEDAPVSATTGPHHAAAILPQIQSGMNEVIASLVAQPDATLAAYVVRSDRGLMLHSWGLPMALTPHYPDDTECEIAGTVLVANAPAPDHEVLLENTDGLSLARTRSDAAGRFCFSKISSGRFRVRAISAHVAFPPEGVTVDIERTSVTGLELRDRADHRSIAPPAPGSSPAPRRRFVIFLLFALLALVVTGGAWWSSSLSRPPPSAPSASPIGVNVAPDTFAQAHAGIADPVRPTASSAGAVSSSGTNPRTSPVEITPPRPPPADLPIRDSGRRPTVSIERHAAGFGVEASGSPANAALPASAAPAAVSSANSGAAANASPGAGAAAAGNASPAAAAPASAIAAPASSAAPASNAAAASSLAAVASAAATPTPPDRTTPTATPPAASPAVRSSTPASLALPTANPAQPTPPPPPAADAVHRDMDPTPTDRPFSTTPEPDSATGQTPSPDTPDSPVKDRRPERAARDDKPALIVNVPTRDEPASPSPSAAMSANEDRAYPASTAAAPDFRRRMRLRITPWQPRLLQDTILPTVPTRVGEDDAIEALRTRLLRERQAQIPLTFKEPVTQVGFALELPAATTGLHRPHWSDITGAAPASATVAGTRAEISWLGTSPPRVNGTLVADDDRELARVTVAEDGSLTLVTAPGVSGWPWIAVERAPADDVGFTATEWSARLEWQVLGGASAPPTWRRDDRWLDNRGHRLELILGERGSGPGACALALVDRVTGWAIVSNIEQTQEISEPTAPRAP